MHVKYHYFLYHIFYEYLSLYIFVTYDIKIWFPSWRSRSQKNSIYWTTIFKVHVGGICIYIIVQCVRCWQNISDQIAISSVGYSGCWWFLKTTLAHFSKPSKHDTVSSLVGIEIKLFSLFFIDVFVVLSFFHFTNISWISCTLSSIASVIGLESREVGIRTLSFPKCPVVKFKDIPASCTFCWYTHFFVEQVFRKVVAHFPLNTQNKCSLVSLLGRDCLKCPIDRLSERVPLYVLALIL